MVNLYVGITDYDWFRFLSALPGLEEVNFWQPGGRTNFKALQPGELFLFKLHAPRNFIVGGGVFARSDILPVSLAWDAFGIANGAPTLVEMRKRIAFYRNQADDSRQDYMIGCRILTQPFFFPEDQWIPIPASWSPHIQQGRTYDTSEDDGRRLWEQVLEREAEIPSAPIAVPRYGEPTLIRPRLGQGGFRISVTDVYQRSCAVTRERTLPILDAAHIRPFSEGGEHDITNGLLLARTFIGFSIWVMSPLAMTENSKLGAGRKRISRMAVTTTGCTAASFSCREMRISGRAVRLLNGIRRASFWDER